ncbi:MAG: alpha/beta hydrolase [Pseudomonadota bacterium]
MRLHVVHNGPAFEGSPLEDGRHPILMLHGFPEFWIAWENVMKELRDEYFIIVPDQRGYNKSDAPQGVENYKAKLLVGDMIALTSSLLGERSFSLAGHDWGASIAYALAINFPEKVDHLIIANGVHPACFQQALIDHPEQAKASAYFHILRSENAGKIMAEDGFRRTFSMFEKFSVTPWLTENMKERYRIAWNDEQRLQAMLHWYNSSPIVVPKEGENISQAALYNVPTNTFRISMPHTLIWGKGDQALLPECHHKLSSYCDNLEKIEVEETDHWILHTHGKKIARHIHQTIK